MAKKTRLHLLGALTATPVLTAGMAQARDFDVGPAGAPVALAEVAVLKAALLALSPAEKLKIAGDRLGEDIAGSSGSGSGSDHDDGRIGRKDTPASAQCPKTGGLKHSGTGASVVDKPGASNGMACKTTHHPKLTVSPPSAAIKSHAGSGRPSINKTPPSMSSGVCDPQRARPDAKGSGKATPTPKLTSTPGCPSRVKPK